MTSEHVSTCYARCCSAKGKAIDEQQAAEWIRILRDFDPTLLDLATTERLSQASWWMDAGDLAETCRILQAAAASGPEEPEHWRRSTFACRKCSDTGWRTVWSPAAMGSSVQHVAGRMDERAWRGKLTTCVVLCPCGAKTNKQRPKRFHRGDSLEHLEYRGSMVEVDAALTISKRIDELLEWAKAWKPANYVDEFASF